jgi:cytochrome b
MLHDMENNKADMHNEEMRSNKVLVWDLPTRLFHWLLVAGVIISFVTGNIGPNAMEFHKLSGYVILALLIFRLAWGFVGNPTARYSSFVKGPSTVFAHVATLLKKKDTPHLGHNPLGGWSIVAMLLVLSVQVATGLFANDDIFTEGPLYLWVSKETSDFLTGLHLINRIVTAAVLAIHVFAVLFYFFYKNENLIGPMITGVKRWHTDVESADGRHLLAAVIFGLASLAVYILVR